MCANNKRNLSSCAYPWNPQKNARALFTDFLSEWRRFTQFPNLMRCAVRHLIGMSSFLSRYFCVFFSLCVYVFVLCSVRCALYTYANTQTHTFFPT